MGYIMFTTFVYPGFKKSKVYKGGGKSNLQLQNTLWQGLVTSWICGFGMALLGVSITVSCESLQRMKMIRRGNRSLTGGMITSESPLRGDKFSSQSFQSNAFSVYYATQCISQRPFTSISSNINKKKHFMNTCSIKKNWLTSAILSRTLQPLLWYL